MALFVSLLSIRCTNHISSFSIVKVERVIVAEHDFKIQMTDWFRLSFPAAATNLKRVFLGASDKCSVI